MPDLCPRPCSRLATAAVFLSVGVVQLVVGIILLRSKYVFLLAGPDFWTSSSNIAVGCLLGVSASVWKHSKTRKSAKHIVRRNLLLALLFSALIINATTLSILLLGKGNTLLSIRLESSGVLPKTYFVNEVLAYAYATSVCSPIVCIVVSIVAMSGNIFRSSEEKISMEMKTPDNTLKKQRSKSFQWVYTPEMLGSGKKVRKAVVLTSSSDSSSEESDDPPPAQQTHVNSVDDLQKVLHRMALGKRDSLLSDSTVMLQQLERRRRDRYNSLIRDRSYMEPVLSRTRDSAMSERNNGKDLINYDTTPYDRIQDRHPQLLTGDSKSSHGSSGYISMEQFGRLGTQRLIPPNFSPCVADDVFSDYHKASPELSAKNFSTQYRKFKENLKNRSEIDGNNRLNRSSNDKKQKLKDTPAVHKSPRMTYVVDPHDLSFEFHDLKKQHDVPDDREIAHAREHLKSSKTSKGKEAVSPPVEVCFSPDGSDFADSFDLSRANSWAGEVVPIEVRNSTVARLSQKLVPVTAPVVPKRKYSSILHKSFEEDMESVASAANPKQTLKGDRKGNLSSFRENINGITKENGLEYPKVGSQSMKKYDLSKMIPMTSISEEPPSTEACRTSAKVSEYNLGHEDSSLSSASSLTSRANKSSSSGYSEMSKGRYQKRESPARDKTSKRKSSSSCKTLRRIWSSSGSERDVDFKDQLVDEDSLIGLSEEELVARQTRTRSIRKEVEQRIKEQELLICEDNAASKLV